MSAILTCRVRPRNNHRLLLTVRATLSTINSSNTSLRSNITCWEKSDRASTRSFITTTTATTSKLLLYRRQNTTKLIHQIRTMAQGVVVEDGKTIINRNPATNEVISRVPCSTPDEIHHMMDLAQTTFHTRWSNHISIQDRIRYIRDAMDELAKRGNEIIPMIVQEMGKPLAEATAEFDAACSKNNNGYMKVLESAVQPVQHGNSSLVVRQPIGTVVVLSPWNFPMDEILLLALPALGSGNTVIVKPSEVCPEVGALVVNTMASKLPKGVLQLAQGDGTVGAQLVKHPFTKMVAMTGSSATGKQILNDTAHDLKRLVLELGGKDPMIVFDDCDIDKAARDAVEYSLCNAGQVCCSIERVYVADTIYDAFCEKVCLIASTFKVGNGMDPTSKVGPLVSRMQMNKVKEHVDDAIQSGAKVIYQSDVPTVTDEERMGSFFPVTVLADVNDGMKLYREETFGPVVSVSKFDNSESEAVRLANDTEYGLGSCVYTHDIEMATRIANQIEAGQVGINCYAIDNMDIACPWVGHKQSGYGYHSGIEGIHNFSIPKTIVYSDSVPR